jgi:hypothetical protein
MELQIPALYNGNQNLYLIFIQNNGESGTSGIPRPNVPMYSINQPPGANGGCVNGNANAANSSMALFGMTHRPILRLYTSAPRITITSLEPGSSDLNNEFKKLDIITPEHPQY